MRHVIENEFIKIEVSELGATLTRFIDKVTNRDLVLGFDNDEEYVKNCGANIGAIIGRNCNRIKNARYVLNDQIYLLSKNDGENNIHGGGINGFAFKKFELVTNNEDELVFKLLSKDMEAGFPGNVEVSVSYKLENNNLLLTFTGTSDKDTIFNLTSHSYFNLGDLSIVNQYLHITTDKYSPVDDKGMTLDKVEDVTNTGFDFKEFRLLQDNLLKLENGIDNNYVWETMVDKLMCEIKNDHLQMNIYSDLPDMHVYTANWLETEEGKYNRKYHKRDAICFECQYYPNAINYDGYMKPILKANQTASHYIKYEIKH